MKSLLIAGGVPHEEHHVDLSKNEQKSEEILALNPAGQVPFVTVGGKPYAESNAIMRYLANTYPKLNKYYPNVTPEQTLFCTSTAKSRNGNGSYVHRQRST